MATAIPGQGWATPVFQLGRGKTLAIPMTVHAAAREKLVQILNSRGTTAGIVLLQGGEEQNQYDTDTEPVFRQDSWVNYLFGVKEPGVYGAISVSTGKTTLFIPKLHEDYRIWCGDIHPPSEFLVSYAVDEVLYTEDLCQWIGTALQMEGPAGNLLLLEGVNSDSGLTSKVATFEGIQDLYENSKVDKSVLYHALATARVTKSQQEIEVMKYCAYVASNAHVEVMRYAQAGMVEYELEAKFIFEIYRKGGCRRCAYTSICACGPNGAILHYGHAAAPNDYTLQATDMALLDMGAEYHGYVSDITCSFPLSGRFSQDQRAIYQGVLNAQIAVLATIRPGASSAIGQPTKKSLRL